MKKVGLLLMGIAVVTLVAATSQAALVSLFTFDSTPNNAVAGAPNGTLVGSPTYTTGTVGTKAMTFNGANYMDVGSAALPQPSLYGDNSGGMWSGSASIWVKSTDTSMPTIARGRNVAEDTTWLIGGGYDGGAGVDQNYMHLFVRTSENTALGGSGAALDWNNGAWHMATYTWNVTTGDVGTGTMTFYFDGVAQSINNQFSTASSDNTFVAPWDNAVVGAGLDGSGVPNEQYTGAIDDLGIWNEVLTPTKAASLYNLAQDTLDYNAANAAALFNIYDTGTPAIVGGQSWMKVGPGTIVGTPGQVVGHNSLVLAADGSGVMIGSAPVDVVWTGTAGTTWSNTANWSPASTPNGVKNTFDDTATGLTADIASAATPTSVVFNNTSKNFTITGASGIGGTATVLKQGTGTVTMSSVNTYSGVTTVEAGKLILTGAAKAMVPVVNNGGANIKGGMLVLDYATEADPVATIKGLLTTSYAAGAWNTGKFQSSTASASRGLGWTDNTGTSKINVAYTVYGDTNLDGTTNFTDLSKLLSKYGQSGVWADGDANYDGTVNFTDLSKMLSTYGQSVGTLTPSPEPSSIVLLVTLAGLVGAWVIRRRKHVA